MSVFRFRAFKHGSAPDKKAAIAFLASGQQRVTFLSLAGGAFGAACILLHSPRMAQVLAPVTLPVPGSAGSAAGNSGSEFGRHDRQGMDAGRQPLYMANLACQTGDYIVSARRVRSTSYVYDTNPPYGTNTAIAEPLRLSLQVMSTRSGQMQMFDHLSADVTVMDNTGQRLAILEAGREFSFPKGLGYVVSLSAPSQSAAYVSRINGVVHLVADNPAGNAALRPTLASSSVMPGSAPTLASGSVTDLPFHIENVPLPWKLRIFGMAGAAIVKGDTARTLKLVSEPLVLEPGAASKPAIKPKMLKGEPMEAVLRRLPPSAFRTPLRPPQPNLLALTPDTPNVLRLYAPIVSTPANPQNAPLQSLTLTCVLTPHVCPNGKIQAGIQLTGANSTPLHANAAVWDNEPFLLALPARALYPGQGADTTLVLYLDLHLDNYPPESLFNAPLPKTLRSRKGERGGALSGQITTSKGAFGLATATLNITRRNEIGEATEKDEVNGKSSKKEKGKAENTPARIEVAIDKNGRFALSNMAAGAYHIALEEVKPYLSPALAPTTLAKFLSQRMGIRQARADRDAQEVVIKVGGRAELSPWVFKEAK